MEKLHVVKDKYGHILHEEPSYKEALQWFISPECKETEVDIVEYTELTEKIQDMQLYVVQYNGKNIGFAFSQDKAKEMADLQPGSTIKEMDYQTFLKSNTNE